MNKRQELEARLKKADRDLAEAVMVVARCAQEVSDCADNKRLCDAFAVNPEEMVELRNALTHWQACTQKFLKVVDEVGEFNRTALGTAVHEVVLGRLEPLPLTDNLHLQAARRAWAANNAEAAHHDYGEVFNDTLLSFDRDLVAFAKSYGENK